MNKPIHPRRALEEVEPLQAASNSSKVFVRILAAPAGWPWDQRRAALLDARHGSPLPIADLALRLDRLDPWRPAQTARFAAFYIRLGDIEDRLETTIEVAGAPRKVLFLSSGEKRRLARAFGAVALASCATVLIIVVAFGAAVLSRHRAEGDLQALEAVATSRLSQAREVQASRAQAEALDAADRGPGLDAVLADLAWAARAKTQAARIETWRWEAGLMAVEVRGEGAPFVSSERLVQAAPKRVRKRVRLWGVGPAPRSGPVAAEPRGAR